ncbi:hypothetical protein EG328_010631 [Venturia inaequalis]|uniref:Uncharacterized protein n=1 Tax=Venturia inaequalis TaxID=5025 RepID=A0A8H3VUM7_VENIN|nr:hypothetical protein EG328_010631 [Venturia inaequalis]KAE9994356.1 hypothetical protein EG327_010796 [Venturia inaequalis]RDI78849.1 hypothetical protein Vi05172_g11144 [Venturia inaequalis]
MSRCNDKNIKKQRPSPTFLSLPCELRQKILSGVYNGGFEHEPLPPFATDIYHILHAHVTYYHITSAAIRNVHPTFCDDFLYVEERWVKSIVDLTEKVRSACKYDDKVFVREGEVWKEMKVECGLVMTVRSLRGVLGL